MLAHLDLTPQVLPEKAKVLDSTEHEPSAFLGPGIPGRALGLLEMLSLQERLLQCGWSHHVRKTPV